MLIHVSKYHLHPFRSYILPSLVLQEYREIIKDLVVDTVTFMHKNLQDKSKNILVEGANATMLDIDFGMYAELCALIGDSVVDDLI